MEAGSQFARAKKTKPLRAAVVLDGPVHEAEVAVSWSNAADGVTSVDTRDGFAVHSMLTRDGRRMVSYLDGTNTVYELVPTNRLPAGLPPVREWKFYGLKATHTDIGLHNSQYIQRHGTVRRIDEAARLIDADTRADDDPAAYRYVMDGFWFWDNYRQDKGMDAAWRIVTNYVASAPRCRTTRPCRWCSAGRRRGGTIRCSFGVPRSTAMAMSASASSPPGRRSARRKGACRPFFRSRVRDVDAAPRLDRTRLRHRLQRTLQGSRETGFAHWDNGRLARCGAGPAHWDNGRPARCERARCPFSQCVLLKRHSREPLVPRGGHERRDLLHLRQGPQAQTEDAARRCHDPGRELSPASAGNGRLCRSAILHAARPLFWLKSHRRRDSSLPMSRQRRDWWSRHQSASTSKPIGNRGDPVGGVYRSPIR